MQLVFHKVSANKINAVHELFRFLHRLRVIGTVQTKTITVPLTEFGKPSVYSLVYEGYDPSTKGIKSIDDRLRVFFNRVIDPDELPYDEQLE